MNIINVGHNITSNRFMIESHTGRYYKIRHRCKHTGIRVFITTDLANYRSSITQSGQRRTYILCNVHHTKIVSNSDYNYRMQ